MAGSMWRLAPSILAYGFQTLILRRARPYLFCLVVTDACNLDCFYCQSKNQGLVHQTWDRAAQALEQAYGRGHRFLVLSGGEPFLWRDGDRRLPDLVRHARALGFLGVMIATNGLEPLSIPDCMYLVTVDGPREVHDAIRQGSFDRVIANARAAASGAVHASITLSRANQEHLEQFVRETAALGCFSGISFNFVTAGPEALAEYGLSREEKRSLLDALWRLKQDGLPVLLSRAAYKAMRADSWKRPIPQMELCLGPKVFPCCRDVGRPEVCGNCGYSTCAEVSQMVAGKPSAILQALAMFKSRPVPGRG